VAELPQTAERCWLTFLECPALLSEVRQHNLQLADRLPIERPGSNIAPYCSTFAFGACELNGHEHVDFAQDVVVTAHSELLEQQRRPRLRAKASRRKGATYQTVVASMSLYIRILSMENEVFVWELRYLHASDAR
jgi:hypothetical protein